MFYNMNFILAFIFIYFNFSLCVKKERYQRLVTKILGSIQTTFNDNSITLYNTNGDSLLRFYNLRLINPALSKMSYEYDETMPLYVTAKNVIITFVNDVQGRFNKYHIGDIDSTDYLVQLTCDSITFFINNKISSSLSTYNCSKVYYSQVNPISTLNSFSFFNNNDTALQLMNSYYSSSVERKIKKSLSQYNLITVDMEIVFEEFREFFKDRVLDIDVDDYLIRNITIVETPIKSKNSKIIDNKLCITFPDYAFNINYTLSNVNYFGQFSVSGIDFNVSHTNISFDVEHIDFMDCGLYSDPQVCQNIFEAVYVHYFKMFYCEYVKDFQDKEECLKKK